MPPVLSGQMATAKQDSSGQTNMGTGIDVTTFDWSRDQVLKLVSQTLGVGAAEAARKAIAGTAGETGGASHFAASGEISGADQEMIVIPSWSGRALVELGGSRQC